LERVLKEFEETRECSFSPKIGKSHAVINELPFCSRQEKHQEEKENRLKELRKDPFPYKPTLYQPGDRVACYQRP
jgi:hypothetical protein